MNTMSAWVLVAGTVALTGCSGSIHFGNDRSIDRFLLADRVSDTLRHKTRAWPTSTRCDGSLRGEKGATQRCWITDREGVQWGVTTTVTSLDDRGIYFDVDVDDKPTNRSETVQQISTEALQQGLKDAVKERQHFDLRSAECDGPLDGKVDATQKCTVVDDEGTKYSVVVTTTSVNGDDIKFKYMAEPIGKPA